MTRSARCPSYFFSETTKTREKKKPVCGLLAVITTGCFGDIALVNTEGCEMEQRRPDHHPKGRALLLWARRQKVEVRMRQGEIAVILAFFGKAGIRFVDDTSGAIGCGSEREQRTHVRNVEHLLRLRMSGHLAEINSADSGGARSATAGLTDIGWGDCEHE